MIEPPPHVQRLAPPMGLALIVAVLDLSTKTWAEQRLAGEPPWVLIPRVLRLEIEVNPGAALGLLGGGSGRTVAVLLGVALVAYLLWLGQRLSASGPIRHTGLGLMLGGAMANVYDRAFGEVDPHGPWGGGPRDGVIDFIVVEPWPGWAWPAFNVADAALVTGAGLLLLTLWRMRQRGMG